MNNEPVEIFAEVTTETDLAWLINDGHVEVWIPKSRCTYNNKDMFIVPEWLAIDKGLV